MDYTFHPQDTITDTNTDSFIDVIKTGQLTRLIHLLEQFFQQRPVRSVKFSNEPALQAVIESFWWDTKRCVPELCLVVDASKSYGNGRYGFVDLFCPQEESVSGCIPIIELKNVTLDGL